MVGAVVCSAVAAGADVTSLTEPHALLYAE